MDEFVVVDIETTGLSAKRHKIIEIAAIKYKNKKKVDEFQTLINPKTRIPSFITRLTGIDNEMVQTAPPIDKMLPHFENFIKDLPFIAHNATFDYNFINHNYQTYLQRPLFNHKICTCLLARRLLPTLPSKKLGAICNHYELTNDAAHRAMGDTMVTAEIFLKFLNQLSDMGVNNLQKILKFQKTPASKLY